MDSYESSGGKWWWREDVLYALACAEAALPVFERADPNDKRPWLAIEAARKWLQNPTAENIRAAVIASGEAWAAGMPSGMTAAIALDTGGAYAAALAASHAASTASKAGEATYTVDSAAYWATIFACEAGVSEPDILRAFARQVAGTPLAPIVTAEQL